jgi:hypothetical protein
VRVRVRARVLLRVHLGLGMGLGHLIATASVGLGLGHLAALLRALDGEEGHDQGRERAHLHHLHHLHCRHRRRRRRRHRRHRRVRATTVCVGVPVYTRVVGLLFVAERPPAGAISIAGTGAGICIVSAGAPAAADAAGGGVLDEQTPQLHAENH